MNGFGSVIRRGDGGGDGVDGPLAPVSRDVQGVVAEPDGQPPLDDLPDRLLDRLPRRLAEDAEDLLDLLTGRVGNRRAFDQAIEHEWKGHGRARSPLTVALLDVDGFKQYNDHEGHLAGDECLRAVARSIGSSLRRDGDLAARYGGEEIAMILPHTRAEDAAGILRGVLRGVRALAIPHPTSKVGRGIVTVSVGVATTIPEGDAPLAPFLDRADKALYEAKSLGRDRLIESPTTL